MRSCTSVVDSSVFKDYTVSARALMTVAHFQREEEEDIEEAPDDE